jgi:septal ring factor EnvC (AmiA/AmiB activator)
VVARKSAYQEVQGALDEKKARIKECDQEISAQAKEQGRLDRKLKDSTVEAKKLDHKVMPSQRLPA